MNEILKPGKYFLGDPCAVLPTKILNGIWDSIFNCSNGKFNINDTDFAVHTTHYGDGIFLDTKNRSYNIESGVMGLVDISIIEEDSLKIYKEHGHIYNFDKPVKFIYDGGIFFIKSGKKIISINTQCPDEYDSDDDNDDSFGEYCHNDDGENIGKTIKGDSDNDSIVEETGYCLSDSDSEEESDKLDEDYLTKTCFFKKK